MGRLTGAVAGPLLAIVGAALVGMLMLIATGHEPLAVGEAFLRRVVVRRSGLEESLVAMTPILIAALAAWIAARVGLWNIGIDGQIVAGALAAGAFAPLLDAWPRAAMWVTVALAGTVAGALWTLLPAVLRVRSGINEIVTTIMMTYVAFALASWLVKGPLNDPAVVAPSTTAIDLVRRLPRVLESRVHFGVVGILVLVLLVAVISRWTVPGILSRFVGESAPAADRIGIPVDRYVLVAFLVSGGIAALAGVSEVIAVRGALQGDWRPSLTLPAFAVLFLARHHVMALIPAAVLLGMLAHASTTLPRTTDLSPSFFPMVEGVLLMLLAVEHRWLSRGGVKQTDRGEHERA
jgi:general nucleoside transport system permease protein